MKQPFYIVLLFLQCFLATAQKQGAFPEAFVVDSTQDMYQKLPVENREFFRPSNSKKLTLKQVLSPEFDTKFAKEPRILDRLNRTHYWVRYGLKNSMDVPYTVAIPVSSSVKEADIYVNDAGKWHHYKNGAAVPWSQRDGDKNKLYIAYTLKPNAEIKVYMGVKGLQGNPSIGNYLKLVKENYMTVNSFDRDQMIYFGFAGFILFAVVFNLFFYYVNREKVYLVYSVMLFFAALMASSDTLLPLLFPESTALQEFYVVLVYSMFFVMFLNTVRFFFGFKNYFPIWDKILAYFPPFCIVSGVIGFYVWKFIGLAVVIGIAVMPVLVVFFGFWILLIIILIKFLRRKDREARLFVIAILPFFAGCVLSVAWDGMVMLTATWAIIVLSWGMFDRFKRLQEEYAIQAVEKERIAREKEEERNALIAEQNIRLEQLVEERTADLEASLESLKQTQDQLIQSEKMASLGELTAGIAHEIQNPLNFVNNFSDVSIELIDEMGEELEKGDTEEALAIAGDIKQNLEKIAHHGRRADSIVKGMLQHSRASSGQKEPTDINALADEYLRLAYHGLRAKDKSFNAALTTHFDTSLQKVTIAGQDVGRVLLNMFTNAFYSLNQKKKTMEADFQPEVIVSTTQDDRDIIITVRDNGFGIPEEIKDKILQPFFTTKPTGEGTGLGLSLSYDIIVKGHGGSIDIDTVEGQFAEFTIRLKKQ